MFETLNEKNIDLYAAKMYSNPQCISIEEFHDDMKRIKYIKRLFNRYVGTGEIKDRLILNHIVIFYNVFSVEAGTRILFCKLDKKLYSALKTFLVYFGYMPERVFGINGFDIISSDISIDVKTAQLLREI